MVYCVVCDVDMFLLLCAYHVLFTVVRLTFLTTAAALNLVNLAEEDFETLEDQQVCHLSSCMREHL